MTTAPDDLGYDDDEPDADDAQAKRDAFTRRKEAKAEKDKELNDLREYKAAAERKEKLEEAKANLNATGPLGAFLRAYDGEPTAEAIRKAVESDPDFKPLIEFTPDPRDEAAQEQSRNAARMKGGDPVAARAAEKIVMPGEPRLRAAHAAKTAATKT